MDFVRSYFNKNEPLTSWTLFSLLFVQISAEVHLYQSNFLQNPYFNTSLFNKYTMQQYASYRQPSWRKWEECSVHFLRSLFTMWWVQFFAATSFWHTSTFSNFRTLPPPSKLKSQNTATHYTDLTKFDFQLAPKGQIISKCLFDVFKFFKKPTKKLTNVCPSGQIIKYWHHIVS